MKILVWNEFEREQKKEVIAAVYPKGIHRAIAEFLEPEEDFTVKTVTMYDEHCGITKELLDETDVLIWWGHVAHHMVPDEVATLVRNAVHEGMGAIFLHSAHFSKPFCSLMGTPCALTWRESGDTETLWVIDPAHPITRGIDRYFQIEHEETYGEPFAVPNPDKVLLISHFSSGEVFRSGLLYERGNGKVFYFRPGDEMYPTYYNPAVQTVIKNAIRFVAPTYRSVIDCPHVRKITDEEPYVK